MHHTVQNTEEPTSLCYLHHALKMSQNVLDHELFLLLWRSFSSHFSGRSCPDLCVEEGYRLIVFCLRTTVVGRVEFLNLLCVFNDTQPFFFSDRTIQVVWWRVFYSTSGEVQRGNFSTTSSCHLQTPCVPSLLLPTANLRETSWQRYLWSQK